MSFLSRLAPRRDADGFWSGLPVGGALGFVYAPCAGPILAAVISVSASPGTTASSSRSASPTASARPSCCSALALGGRRRHRPRAPRPAAAPVLQRGFGAVMVLTAVLMFTSVDLRFQRRSPASFPCFLTNPTGGLERSAAVEDRLADLRGKPKFDAASSTRRAAAAQARRDAALPGVADAASCRCSARRPSSPRTGALVQLRRR